MNAYAVRIDELLSENGMQKGEYRFVHPKETEAEYPIPSAFAAYVPYLNIRQGKDNFVIGDEEK